MIFDPVFLKQDAETGSRYVLRREYTDLHGNRRVAVFVETGPAGNRWLLDGRLVTIDFYERRNKHGHVRPEDPWKSARDIVDTWVPQK